MLRGQTRRADGGLYYASFDEFRAALDFLLDNPSVADQLGAQGKAYVESQYRWPSVMRKVESLPRSCLKRLHRPADSAPVAPLDRSVTPS